MSGPILRFQPSYLGLACVQACDPGSMNFHDGVQLGPKRQGLVPSKDSTKDEPNLESGQPPTRRVQSKRYACGGARQLGFRSLALPEYQPSREVHEDATMKQQPIERPPRQRPNRF